MPRQITNKINSEIQTDVLTIQRHLVEGVFSFNGRHPQKRAVFGEVMVALRDLVAKSAAYAGKPIIFRDDVVPMKFAQPTKMGEIKHVGDLITFMRDAVSHPDGDQHMAAPNVSMTFGTVYGKKNFQSIVVSGADLEPPCDYEDDIAFTYGPQRIYMKRHIVRAFEEAKANLFPLINLTRPTGA